MVIVYSFELYLLPLCLLLLFLRAYVVRAVVGVGGSKKDELETYFDSEDEDADLDEKVPHIYCNLTITTST